MHIFNVCNIPVKYKKGYKALGEVDLTKYALLPILQTPYS